MKLKFSLGAALIAALAITVPAGAANTFFKAMPGTFDPDKTKTVVAQWKAQVGLPDAGGSRHGLILEKNAPTPTNAAAGAAITGVEGEVAQEPWGYDLKGDCGAGSPRFNLTARDGFHFVGGCSNGTVTPGPEPGWVTVRFDLQDDAFPPVAPGATIQSLSLIVDEGNDTGTGKNVVDNILVNGRTIEKPGNNG